MTVPTPQAQKTPPAQKREPASFNLHLANFQGPFDLLLHLISQKKLDITDIALAEVTDEFLAYISDIYASDTDAGLNTASEFLVTAATLLDLKTARLLPRGTAEITANTELLEARDLLFARLLQYRAFREVTSVLEERFRLESQRFARSVALDARFSKVLPELVFDIGPEDFARIAARALAAGTHREEAEATLAVDTEHLHLPATTIAAEEAAIVALLRERSELSFTDLLADAGAKEVAIVRFLAVLELYKEGTIDLEQEATLGTITVSARALENFPRQREKEGA